MRVLLAAPGLPPGGRWGTEVYSDHLARGLRDIGHRVTVFLPDDEAGEPRLDEGLHRGLRVLRARTPRPVGRSLVHAYRNPHQEELFREALARERPEVVHVLQLSWRLSLRLPALARAFGARTVATLTDLGVACHRGHGLDDSLDACGLPRDPEVCARCIRHGSSPSMSSPPRGALSRMRAGVERGGMVLRHAALDAWARAGGAGGIVRPVDVERRRAEVGSALAALDARVLPTRALGEELRRAGLGSERAHVLPYAFDTSSFLAARSAPRSSRRRLGYFGQLAPHKGVAVLVEAAELLLGRGDLPPWELCIHGAAAPGRWRDFPRRLLRRIDGKRVRLEPPFPTGDSARILGGLDGLVVPSLWVENAPLSALEARAAGVPLVVSDVGGLTEIVREGVDGWHVPAGNARALSERLALLLSSPLRRMPDPGLPMSFVEHLEALGSIYRGEGMEERMGGVIPGRRRRLAEPAVVGSDQGEPYGEGHPRPEPIGVGGVQRGGGAERGLGSPRG